MGSSPTGPTIEKKLRLLFFVFKSLSKKSDSLLTNTEQKITGYALQVFLSELLYHTSDA